MAQAEEGAPSTLRPLRKEGMLEPDGKEHGWGARDPGEGSSNRAAKAQGVSGKPNRCNTQVLLLEERGEKGKQSHTAKEKRGAKDRMSVDPGKGTSRKETLATQTEESCPRSRRGWGHKPRQGQGARRRGQ